MDRLVIHLGLAKAASKTLQTKVFPHFPGFRGDGSDNAELARWFGQIYLSGERRAFRSSFMRDRLASWVQAALNEKQPQLVISVESLSRWCSPSDDVAAWPVQHSRRSQPRRGQHPVTVMLSQLREVLPKSVHLFTILILRNQTDWLGSLAAQVGVADTSFIPRILDDADAALDYYSLVQALEGLNGPAQNSTYFLEEGLPTISMEMARSFAPDLAQGSTWIMQNEFSRSNERRVAERQWIVSTASFKPVSRRGAARRAWSKIHKKLPRNVPTSLPAQGAMDASKSSGNPLTISDEQRDAVRRHGLQTNALLSQHLAVDLGPWGY